ncbi:dTDP-4-dehydrorhamnose 3,5-epimerase [soil metagenome]
MDVRELSVPGCIEFTPRQHHDPRGVFLEWFTAASFQRATGQRLHLAQTNHSGSRRGTVRGLHYALVPPGQAKYVYCPRGAALDVVVDIRAGSPTFGAHDTVRLDEVDRRAIYVPEGIGHAFVALTDDTTLTYLCSTAYDPEREKAIHPLDPALALPWPQDIEPVLSARDQAAPTLAEAGEQGMLPSYGDCLERYRDLRTNGQ